MTFSVGFGPAKKRRLSPEAHETARALQLAQSVATKMKRASLAVFDEQGIRAVAPIPLPLSPTRYEKYVDQWSAAMPAEAQNTAKRVKQSFKYPPLIQPEDLAADKKGFQDERMEKWLQETQAMTSEAMEQQSGTPFVPIPPEHQDDSCYRYALEVSGLHIPYPIQSPLILRKILQEHFVSVDEPQERDLVLFLRGGQPQHLGIYHQGQILSKEGNGDRVAYIRPIDNLISSYGENIYYLRQRKTLA